LDDKEFARAMVGKNDFDRVDVDLSRQQKPLSQWPLQHCTADNYRSDDSGEIGQ
jgi:hypothetical protein